MGPFEQRGCAIRQAAPRCSNPQIADVASDISNEGKLRLVYRVLTEFCTPARGRRVGLIFDWLTP